MIETKLNSLYIIVYYEYNIWPFCSLKISGEYVNSKDILANEMRAPIPTPTNITDTKYVLVWDINYEFTYRV